MKTIILDGHDAVGKTTIGKKLVSQLKLEALKAEWVEPYAIYNGEKLIDLYIKKDYEGIIKFTKERFYFIQKKYSDNDILVFDRMWLTAITLLPPSLRMEIPIIGHNILLWIDEKTTLERLTKRTNFDNAWEHKKYCDLYLELANKYSIKVINTSINNIASTIDNIMAGIKEQVLWK